MHHFFRLLTAWLLSAGFSVALDSRFVVSDEEDIIALEREFSLAGDMVLIKQDG